MPALRPVHFRDLIRVFEADGFSFDRQEGDHRIYIKPGLKRPLVIPQLRGCAGIHHQEPVKNFRNEPRPIFRTAPKRLRSCDRMQFPSPALPEATR